MATRPKPRLLLVGRPVANAWMEHRRKWEKCQLCPLHETAHKHVLARGCIPAEVLFIGEAPGPKEDADGYPFVGPAGKVLDKIIYATKFGGEKSKRTFYSWCITNTVGCMPYDDEGGFRQPSQDEMGTCSPRVVELIRLVSPTVIILLGKVAAKQYSAKSLNLNYGIPSLELYHPSYILRTGGAKDTNLNYKRTVFTLQDFLHTHLD